MTACDVMTYSVACGPCLWHD